MPKRIRQEKVANARAEKQEAIGRASPGLIHPEFERALDAGDVSFIDLLQSVDIKLVDIRQEELTKMDAAKRKLNEGTYGVCEECGKDISEERLAACLECEERFARTEIQGRGPAL